jgi:mono/diheme cytochrome c family protein
VSRRVVLALGLLLGAAAAADQTAPSGDAEAGRKVALNVCANCHVVAADQKAAPWLNPPATPFLTIANRPTAKAERLRGFVAGDHPSMASPGQMPAPRLTAAQVDDVVAYLLTLRKPR